MPVNDVRGRLVEAHLDNLVRYAESSTKKGFRARLVEATRHLGAFPVAADRHRLARAIEDIHLGSLIVDDIQDGSTERRGQHALHAAFGIPLALNAGNYLYMRALRTTHGLNLPDKCLRRLQGLLLDCMAEAHEGQAIDLGVQAHGVPQAELPHVSEACARSKTGALVKAACGAGYLLHTDCAEESLDALLAFGTFWGATLQKLDDIGHYVASRDGRLAPDKAFEDFRHRRPTWVWATAARELSNTAYARFRKLACQTPESEELDSLLSPLLRRELLRLTEGLADAFAELRLALPARTAFADEVAALNQDLLRAYVSGRAIEHQTTAEVL